MLFLAGGLTVSGQYRKIEQRTFKAGEYLEYRVHYGAVTAGTARLLVQEKPVTIQGRPCFHVIGQGVSSKAFSLFYRVNDRYETFIDQDGLFSWKYKRKIEEGGFRAYTEVDFDQAKHKAYERKDHKKDVTTYDVPPAIQDVLSAFYFARTQNYEDKKPGDITKFQNFIDRQVFDLDVEYLGKEVLEVGGMKYRCVKLKPLVQEGGLFRHEGDLFLWISDDENRIPVRIQSDLVIGSIQVDLKKAKNLLHPLTSRVR